MPVSMDSTCAVEENAEVFDGQRVGQCYRQAEGCSRSEWDCALSHKTEKSLSKVF